MKICERCGKDAKKGKFHHFTRPLWLCMPCYEYIICQNLSLPASPPPPKVEKCGHCESRNVLPNVARNPANDGGYCLDCEREFSAPHKKGADE